MIDWWPSSMRSVFVFRRDTPDNAQNSSFPLCRMCIDYPRNGTNGGNGVRAVTYRPPRTAAQRAVRVMRSRILRESTCSLTTWSLTQRQLRRLTEMRARVESPDSVLGGRRMYGIGLTSSGHRCGVRARRKGVSVLALVGACLVSLAVPQTASSEPAAGTVDTGFAIPFSGAPGYEHLAPPQMTSPDQLNQPLGQQAADEIAAQIGLDSEDALSEQQYRDLVTGGGVGGSREAAEIIDECARILTNTNGRPLYSTNDGNVTSSVLASYGLYVNSIGLLESPANADAPTRQVNSLIAPGGFVGTWMRNNGATQTLVALYQSAYTVQAVYGFASQQMSGTAQLVTNTKGGASSEVGMSMAPPLWIVNFALLYILKPSLAAAMPAQWAPIPSAVADAITSSPTGQVPFSDYASYFE